jgi:predicted secreted acid phosphatase
MACDNLADFSLLFKRIVCAGGRGRAALSGPIAAEWGRGWFVLPNSAYGTALKGTLDEIFPADKTKD